MTDYSIKQPVPATKENIKSHDANPHAIQVNNEVADTTEDFTIEFIKTNAFKTMTNN